MASALARAEAGIKAVKERKWDKGIELLTSALNERPAPAWFLERSKAYLRANEFIPALRDADTALYLAFDRANRDFMADAQLRRAIAFFRLGQFANADVCAFWAFQIADGAKALENDGQQDKTDPNGDYLVRLEDVQNAVKQDNAAKPKANQLPTAGRFNEDFIKNQCVSWRIQALTQMEKLPVGHDGRKTHSLVKYPKVRSNASTDQRDPVKAQDKGVSIPSSATSWEEVRCNYNEMRKKYKTRLGFYQTNTTLHIDIFARGLSEEKVKIQAHPNYVVVIPTEKNTIGDLQFKLDLGFSDRIQPKSTQLKITPIKITLTLEKEKAGKWPTLRPNGIDFVDLLSENSRHEIASKEFEDTVKSLGFKSVEDLDLPDFDHDSKKWFSTIVSKFRNAYFAKLPATPAADGTGLASYQLDRSILDADVTQMIENHLAKKSKAILDLQTPNLESVAAQNPPSTDTTAPSYPTSSKKGPKNWDTLNLDDEDGDDADKDVNDLFRKIYKDADPDSKRAMMKSFIESNGTALSTSWGDAKSKTYGTEPPDGVEAKKW